MGTQHIKEKNIKKQFELSASKFGKEVVIKKENVLKYEIETLMSKINSVSWNRSNWIRKKYQWAQNKVNMQTNKKLHNLFFLCVSEHLYSNQDQWYKHDNR